MNEIILHPPGGVTINQWKNGSIHFRCTLAEYPRLAAALNQLAGQLLHYHTVAEQRAATQVAPALPQAGQNRIGELEAELARLRGIGVPVSVNTKPPATPAQQVANMSTPPTAVGPSVMEVAAALASRNINHPAAAAMAVAVPAPVMPPGPVFKPLPPDPIVVPPPSLHQNPGPALAGVIPPLREGPQIRRNGGTPAPDAPHTIVSGGPMHDDGELGPPPASI
jgi:hypothetical protein